jgi:ATP-binding cassette, subfamily B, bacterial PglK
MRWPAGLTSQGGSVSETMNSFANRHIPQLLAELWKRLPPRRRRQFAMLMGLLIVASFAEVLSLASVVPFLGVLISPDKVFKYAPVRNLAHAWGATTAQEVVLPLTIAFAVAALAAGAIRMLLLWASTRLAYATGSDISVDVYRRTLYQPYWVHVARNSSEAISGITANVADTVNALNQLLILISSAVLLVIVTAALIAIDPVVATVAAGGFGACYGLITWAYRSRLHRNSERIAREHIQVIKALQEGLGAIRDVLLDGTQSASCDIYRKADVPLRSAQGNNNFISGSPRFAMEALGTILIAALAYVISHQPGGVTSALPMLGALAIGAQRLLPALQQGYLAWTTIAGSRTALAHTVGMLKQPLPVDISLPGPSPLTFRESVRFEDMYFRYSGEGPWVIEGLDLTISKGTRVGFVGSTGSGKSTALDLLMGLLLPVRGRLLVDGEPVLGTSIRAWQKTIAHVPQSIYLADASLAENIAFGVPTGAIDVARVKQAARQAQIADFIEARPAGYAEMVGERGVRLSGGQRQRIGIARALYKQARVLIFDEATSALDNATEQSVMDAIDSLDRELTIVLIAHRLTTVRRCDFIVEMERGKVVAQGTYEQLLERSPSFRRMAKAVA